MKIGISTRVINPPFSMPMAGFYSRLDTSDGVHDDLEFTAIYLSDGIGEAWVGCADLCQLPDWEELRTEGLEGLRRRLGCRRSSLFLNVSHTHGAPGVNPHPLVMSPEMAVLATPRYGRLIARYREMLWNWIAEACEEARSAAVESTIWFGEGKTTFPMNRRRTVNGRIENAPCPEGPVDDRLRVLAIKDPRGELRALGLLLACHPTSTGPQHRFTADFVGAWRRQMLRRLSGNPKMFFLQTCGGEARPAFTSGGEAWRPALLEELPIMGEHLTRETLPVLDGSLQPVCEPMVRTAQTIAELPCQILGRESFQSWLREEDVYLRSYAAAALESLADGRPLPSRIPIDLTVLRLGRDLGLLGANCELLTGIGRILENALGWKHAIALGYTNGVTCYIPDNHENSRGGYEAESYIFEKWSGPLLPEIDERLAGAARNLAAETGAAP